MRLQNAGTGAATLYNEHPVVSVWLAIAGALLWFLVTGRLAMAGLLSAEKMSLLRLAVYVPCVILWLYTTKKMIVLVYRRWG